ncbi:MAG: hypothetical protein AAB434_03985 [Planctomycetota bacterium]
MKAPFDEVHQRFERGERAIVEGNYERAGAEYAFVVEAVKWFPCENKEVAGLSRLAAVRAEAVSRFLGNAEASPTRSETNPVPSRLPDDWTLNQLRRDPGKFEEGNSEVMAKANAMAMSPDFRDTPLPDVVTQIREISRLNILIDEESIDAAEAIRVTWSALGQRLPGLLDEVARQCRLRWYIEQGCVILTRRP